MDDAYSALPPGYGSGKPSKTFGVGRGCARCGRRLSVYNPDVVCAACDAAELSQEDEMPTTTVCEVCGGRTRAKGGVCRSCKSRSTRSPEYERWVPKAEREPEPEVAAPTSCHRDVDDLMESIETVEGCPTPVVSDHVKVTVGDGTFGVSARELVPLAQGAPRLVEHRWRTWAETEAMDAPPPPSAAPPVSDVEAQLGATFAWMEGALEVLASAVPGALGHTVELIADRVGALRKQVEALDVPEA